MSFRHAIIIVCLLAAVEGIAWWWMHPPLAGLNEPVLTWDPEGDTRQKTEEVGDGEPSGLNPQSSGFPSSLTPRPEIYAKSAPILRCSDGKVYSVDSTDGVTITLSFFEWNLTDTGSMLEAFQHMPEYCMGAIGFQLVEKAKPITYEIESSNLGRSDDSGQRTEVGGQEAEPEIQNSKFKIHSPPPETLIFDHTVFRAPGQSNGSGDIVHSFKAVWVSGLTGVYGRQGLFGNDRNDERGILLKSAIKRFRPAHTRVIQGAVRGAPDAGIAWKIFEDTMLKDLKLEARR